jgi:hypothetical protein
MRTVSKPTTYLTIAELQEMATAKFKKAEAFPDGPAKHGILKSAHAFRSLAETKGWLSSELRPPK